MSGLTTGLQLLEEVQQRPPLSSGCPSLDSLLHGGFSRGQVSELTGAVATGKTQVCMAAAAAAAAGGKNTLYLDTNGSFVPRRLASLLSGFGLGSQDRQPAMERVHVVKVHSIAAACCVIDELVAHLQAVASTHAMHKYVLVVLDSVTPLVSPVLGAGNTMQGHALMVLLARQLRACAQQHSLAVIVTNSLLGGEERPRPALGDSWRVQSDLQVQLVAAQQDAAADEHTERSRIQARISSSAWLPYGASASFTISSKQLLPSEPAGPD